jgi:hypothetical protein
VKLRSQAMSSSHVRLAPLFAASSHRARGWALAARRAVPIPFPGALRPLAMRYRGDGQNRLFCGGLWQARLR